VKNQQLRGWHFRIWWFHFKDNY